MQTIHVPTLHCPFISRISPFVEEVDRHSSAWLRRFNLLGAEEQYERYHRYKFAWMTCRTYPCASFEFLCAANNLNSLLFVMDDQLDHSSPETDAYRNRRFMEQVISDFVGVLRYDRQVEDRSNPTLAALSDFWNRLRRISSPAWQCQFTLSVKAVFEAGMWELENARQQRHPAMRQYMCMRPFFAAANLATDLVEPATGNYLPVFVLQNELFRKMVDLCRGVICWSNDLFSLSKELAHGDEHNLVVVIEHERNIPLEQAIQATADIHNNEMAEFCRLRTSLPSFGPAIDAAVQQHVNDMGTMMRGFMDWSIYDTARYEFEYEAG